jgi:dTDP-4-dehydrorhamnose 3,5-epimerase
MKIEKTNLEGVLVISPVTFSDTRGFFFESYQYSRYKEFGISTNFIQDNISRSSQGTLRGLHYQVKKPQAKLISVIQGEIFDVAVDIRKNSPTFAHWFGTILNDSNHKQLYIPEGFAHGFYVLSQTADVIYKCNEYYDAQDEGGIIWNDSTINIEWPIQNSIVNLSKKDSLHSSLSEIPTNKFPK